MKLFDGLVAQRRFVYLAVTLSGLAGLYAGIRLPSAIYPELLFPRITIVAEGSALDAGQVVFSVTRPIEEVVGIVPGVARVRSRSIRGASEINVYFGPNTDMQVALQQVQARVNEVRPRLPPAVALTIERLTPSVFPILSYNLEGGDPAVLYDIGRYQIRPILSRIRGVGRVDVMGSSIREIEVVADPARLATLGMTYQALAAAISRAMGIEAVGRVSRDYRQFLVVTTQGARTAEDVGAVALAGGLRVRDIASVSLGTEDRVRAIAGDGRPAVLLNVTRQIGGNTLAIADSVAAAVAELGRILPAGVRLKPVYDQAALVRDAMSSVRDAMLIGAALAVIILLVFLHQPRITAISASSIPLTLAITVSLMALMGQSFNLMTLGALAIAIGLVIDDAVVVTENIIRHLQSGAADRRGAVRAAVQELIWPVTTSTLTTVVVFLPLGLLSGVVGQFFQALSITLATAVLVSLALALTVIPLLAEQYLTPGALGSATPSGVGARLSAWISILDDRYVNALGRVLARPRLVVATALGLVALGLMVYLRVGTGFLPEMDEGAFVLDYWTPGGTSLAESDRMVHVAEEVLASEPEVTGTSRRLGAELGLFATEQHRGDLVVRLQPEHERERSSFAVIDDVRGKIHRVAPRLRVEFVQILSDVINDLAGAARPVEIKLFGENPGALEAYARSLAGRLKEIEGLEDLYNGVADPAGEMLLRVDDAEAARVGLDPTQISEQVSGALLGTPAGEVRQWDRAIAIRVRAPDSVRTDPLQLGSLPIITPRGRQATPLGALATITPATSRAELLRENQQQMVTLTADVSGRSLGAVMSGVREVLQAAPPPHGIRLELGGQYANQQEAFRALLLVLALAAVSVVSIMVVQFQAFTEPLLITLAAPVSFVGALALLWVSGAQLNVSSLMGLILLVGLIVKNGILLLDFTRHRMLNLGESLETAVREAARVRLRPILMTTLCTLFGLAPLALGLGAGSELQRPLALAVMGGLALSTPITLFVVPTLLVAIRGRGYVLGQRRQEPEPV